MRILHVVGAMNRGGVETWLMHILGSIDKQRYEMDFLVHVADPGLFDNEIRSQGSKITSCAYVKSPILYAWFLFRYLTSSGNRYDIIHSHVHGFSGWVLMVGAFAGVPIRIAHSHSDLRFQDQGDGFFRYIYKLIVRWLISIFATHRLAVSKNAAVSLFGKNWRRKSTVMYCGVDLKPFSVVHADADFRASFGIDSDDVVIGHVGRMEQPKNHMFLLDVFKEALSRDRRCRLLLVGDGSLRCSIEDYARKIGVNSRVIFAGSRDDVPRILLSAMNVFIFPSLWEGLPLTLIEAQAAGLRCIVSESVTAEVSLDGCTYLPLSIGAAAWADVLLANLELGRCTSGYESVFSSAFSLPASLSSLLGFYEKAYKGVADSRKAAF